MKTKIFISYVRENLEIVQKIKDELTYAGVNVWLDEISLKPGVRWKVEIKNSIEESDFFIAIFSKENLLKVVNLSNNCKFRVFPHIQLRS